MNELMNLFASHTNKRLKG